MSAWAATGPSLEVLVPGLMTTVQDLGRPGLAHLGIPRSGAADRNSLRRANLLVGNAPGAPALETVGGGLRLLTTDGDVTVTLTGAPVDAAVNGALLPMDTATVLTDGSTLELGAPAAGTYTYVSCTGGILVERMLDSCSRDVLSALGPAPLQKGQHLLLGEPRLRTPRTGLHTPSVGCPPTFFGLDGERDSPSPLLPPPTSVGGQPTLGVLLGPDDDEFEPQAIDSLLNAPFTVSPDSNRVGLRLSGPSLPTRGSDERASAGLAHGALQVPPVGQPILMLADHPTTGGYPVIAVLSDRDLDRAAQLRIGQSVRFTTR